MSESFWKELFNFLKGLVPNVIAFFGGYKVGQADAEKHKQKLEALRVEVKRVETEKRIVEENSRKSSRDLVNDAIDEGKRSRDKK